MATLTTPETMQDREVFWERYKKEVMAVRIVALLAAAGFGGLVATGEGDSHRLLQRAAESGDDRQSV